MVFVLLIQIFSQTFYCGVEEEEKEEKEEVRDNEKEE